MIIRVDAQLSPAIARWLADTFGLQVYALRDIGLRNAEDEEIFEAAREASAAVMTQDADFAALVQRVGPPPQVIWLTCGNTSNARLRAILTAKLSDALRMLAEGERLVEIKDVQ